MHILGSTLVPIGSILRIAGILAIIVSLVLLIVAKVKHYEKATVNKRAKLLIIAVAVTVVSTLAIVGGGFMNAARYAGLETPVSPHLAL